MIWNVALNYLILVICVMGFSGGAITALILPVLQIALSCFNYSRSKKWQTVLVLEIHLLISTVMGLFLEGYLYLKYISDDAESVLVLYEIIRIGAVLVFSLGIITTLLKFIQQKVREKNGTDQHTGEISE